MIARRRLTLGLVALAVASPPAILTLALRGVPPPADASFAPRQTAPTPSLADLPPLFDDAGRPVPAADPGSAPVLVGVAGRLPGDAVALLRLLDGSTHALRPGDAIDGWRLTGLEADAATFSRGGERVRSVLPAGDR